MYNHCFSQGLSRLERIYREIAQKTLAVEIECLHIIDIRGSYMALRSLDQRQPTGNKYIVLDISNISRLQDLLHQVSWLTDCLPYLKHCPLGFIFKHLQLILFKLPWVSDRFPGTKRTYKCLKTPFKNFSKHCTSCVLHWLYFIYCYIDVTQISNYKQ